MSWLGERLVLLEEGLEHACLKLGRAPAPSPPRLCRGHPDRRRPERGVLVECAQAFLATEAALADAAEGELYARADAPAVDVDLAGADLAREPEGAVDVLGPDRGGEVVADAVRDAQRLVLVAERDDGQDRPEDLVGGDRARWVGDVEDRGLEEPAVVEPVGAPAADDEPGAAGVAGRLDVRGDAGVLQLRDERPHVV